MRRVQLIAVLIIGLAVPAWASRAPTSSTSRKDNYATLKQQAAQGNAVAQARLGDMYFDGRGAPQDYAEAARWWRMAAERGYATAQNNLAYLYAHGQGVPRNEAEAAKWCRMAANQGHATAQINLGVMYLAGKGVQKDYTRAHMWFNLAAAQGHPGAAEERAYVERFMIPNQIVEAQRLASQWKPTPQRGAVGMDTTGAMLIEDWFSHYERHHLELFRSPSPEQEHPDAPEAPKAISSGTGFIVSRRGHVLTTHHVVERCTMLRTKYRGGESVLAVVATDAGNDLALLSLTLPPSDVARFAAGRGGRPGDSVVVMGFPLRGLLASEPNVTTGTISALSGLRDDTRLLQITAPVQPGNSGAPLIDQSGNVIGVVVAKLDAIAVARSTGDIPQNVNFAIKAGVVRAFLDAHSIDYKIADSTGRLESADIAERGREFTIVVECSRTEPGIGRLH